MRTLEEPRSKEAVTACEALAQIKGVLFKDWDANFLRLERVILQQIRAGAPATLGPIQSTMYPLHPQVSLAICAQVTPPPPPP